MKLPKWIISLGRIALISCLAASFLAWWTQERLIFFPSQLADNYVFDFPGQYTERWFQTQQGEALHSLHFTQPESKGLVLYFHGNAGSLAGWGRVSEDFTPYGLDTLIIDYPGYGKSEGSIDSEDDLHRVAADVFKEVSKEYDTIILYGRSIGTGVASQLAATFPAALLILECPFYTFPDLVSYIYPYLPSFMLRYEFNTAKNIQALKIPVHLIHGTADRLIPHHSSVRLGKLGDHIKVHSIPNGSHNGLPATPQYRGILERILQVGSPL